MSNNTERIGVHTVGAFFEKCHIIFREQVQNDNGIDAHIEIENTKNESTQLIALQIKCGKSYFSNATNEHINFYFDSRLYNYWTSYSIPVLILLVDDETNTIYWQHICDKNIKKTEKNYVIKIPKTNILCEKDKERFLDISNQPQYIKNLDYLRLNIPLIIAAKEKKVILESEEWVNKCSGRGSTVVKIYEGDQLEQTIEWKYWFPYQLYQNVFKRLFPWANFEIDKEFYEEDDLQNYHDKHCFYDKDNDKYIPIDMAYEEYLNTLPEIRYVLRAGEVGFYKLILKPNKIGESMLELNDYLENGNPYDGVHGEINPHVI